MPGILGIVSSRPSPECEELVQRMVDSMCHEPFYLAGARCFPELGVYAGWVAKPESSGALQDDEAQVALIFAGECFQNTHDRPDVQRWVLDEYNRKGEDCFAGLNGLFSGLLIDRQRALSFLFNDRYGMERLYCHSTSDAFYFASEAKALLKVCPETRSFDEVGVGHYLSYGCTVGARTLFKGISLLPPGSAWSLVKGGIKNKRSYFDASKWESQEPLSAADFKAEFTDTFQRILPRYTQGEGLGVSLTAGLDTRMILAALPPSRTAPISYTYDGAAGETLDAKIAARLAAVCGMDHKVVRLEQDFFTDFAAHAESTVFVTDGAFGVLGAHELYLSRKARVLAPLRLTGVFGGEIMRGVSTFKPLQLSPQLLSPEMREMMVPVPSQLPAHPVSKAAFAEIPWSIFGSIAACRSQLGFRTPYLDNEIVALAYRTPAILRLSSHPARGLIARFNPALAAIPTDMGISDRQGLENVWRQVSAKITFKLDYLANDGLPHRLSSLDPILRTLNSRRLLLGHHKYLHYRAWLRKELALYLREALNGCGQSPFWNAVFVRGLAERHIEGRGNYVREINAVLTLDAVERSLLRVSPVEPEKRHAAGASPSHA